jgi:hypothetical protein
MGQRVGCPDELLAATSAPAGGQSTAAKKPAGNRLKGKARKQAKAGASASATLATEASSSASAPTPSAPEQPKYVLAIKNFVPLAEFISSSEIDKFKVDVPPSFTTAI